MVGALDRAFEVLVSVPLVLEYEAVLTRPEHLEASGLTAREVNEVLDALVKVATPVPLRFLWRPRLKDPADEMVLETAVNGAADWLATSIFAISLTPPGILRSVWHDHPMYGGRFGDMRRSNVALRLQASILDEARRVSETEGVALNQFINVAVAEKLSALRTEEYFRERAARGDVAKAKRILKRAGRGNPPLPGDELD